MQLASSTRASFASQAFAKSAVTPRRQSVLRVECRSIEAGTYIWMYGMQRWKSTELSVRRIVARSPAIAFQPHGRVPLSPFAVDVGR